MKRSTWIGLLKYGVAVVLLALMVSLNWSGLVALVRQPPYLPALAGNRVLFRDGIPVATHTAGQSDFLVPMDPGREWEARQALVRRSMVPGPRTPN